MSLEYDPIADRIADIENNCIGSAPFQEFIGDVLERGGEFLLQIHADVLRATGEDGIDVRDLDALLSAARALRSKKRAVAVGQTATAHETGKN